MKVQFLPLGPTSEAGETPGQLVICCETCGEVVDDYDNLIIKADGEVVVVHRDRECDIYKGTRRASWMKLLAGVKSLVAHLEYGKRRREKERQEKIP